MPRDFRKIRVLRSDDERDEALDLRIVLAAAIRTLENAQDIAAPAYIDALIQPLERQQLHLDLLLDQYNERVAAAIEKALQDEQAITAAAKKLTTYIASREVQTVQPLLAENGVMIEVSKSFADSGYWHRFNLTADGLMDYFEPAGQWFSDSPLRSAPVIKPADPKLVIIAAIKTDRVLPPGKVVTQLKEKVRDFLTDIPS